MIVRAREKGIGIIKVRKQVDRGRSIVDLPAARYRGSEFFSYLPKITFSVAIFQSAKVSSCAPFRSQAISAKTGISTGIMIIFCT